MSPGVRPEPPRRASVARVVTLAFAAGALLALGSFVLARRSANRFFRDAVALPPAVKMAPNVGWWLGPLERGFTDLGATGPWSASSCANLSCDFAPTIELSLTGRVLRTVPSDLARRFDEARTSHHRVLYALLVPAERVRAALPPLAPPDKSAPIWDATLPGGEAGRPEDTLVVTDRGAVTLVRLPDPWDLAAATERPPRLARLDAWMRQQFAGRHIICGDETLLLEGLPPTRERHVVTTARGDAFLRWLDRRPHEGWRVID